MADQMPGGPAEHAEYEALAAGYALHALEPQDEQRLSAHLMTCPGCARLVADTASLGAAFADLLEAEAPPVGLRERILAAAAAEPRQVRERILPEPPAADSAPAPAPARTPPAVPRRLPTQRRFLRGRFAVGAFAAAIAVAVAVPVTLAASHHGSGGSGTSSTALAQWLLQPSAHEVALSGSSGTATAVLTDQGVYLVAGGMTPNDRASSVYVLWAADAGGQRRAVTTFDVRGGAPVQVTTGKLPYAASSIRQLAISFEHGRTAPAQPTDVLLTGTAA